MPYQFLLNPVHLSLNIPEGSLCVIIKPYEIFSDSLQGCEMWLGVCISHNLFPPPRKTHYI